MFAIPPTYSPPHSRMSMPMDADRLESIAERLAAIEEELRDLAYDRLRDRARDPDSDAGQAANKDEKRLEQARRAIAKAINALAPISVDD
jgi:hypothetical protein